MPCHGDVSPLYVSPLLSYEESKNERKGLNKRSEEKGLKVGWVVGING